MEEPLMLPARLPNLLLNGASGIAVGMATDIPPHNLREVAAACMHLLDEPEATTRALLKHVKGPDLPTGAEIISRAPSWSSFYDKGTGSYKARAVWEVEKERPHRHHAAAVPGVRQPRAGADRAADAREEAADGRGRARRVRSRESDPPGDRAALEPRRCRAADGAPVRDHRSRAQLPRQHQRHRLDGRPRVMGLKALLTEWLEFRRRTVRRRLEFRLDKVARAGCTSSMAC
jgi:topoisomerase-4 subunit A